MKRILVIVLSFFFMNSCSFYRGIKSKQSYSLEKLRNELENIFNDPEFSNAHWGVAIQSLKSGEYIYLKNENKNFIPASNMKLFTTAAALIKLTPDFKYCTKIFRNGEISEDGVLTGDIVIKGSGDPSINGRYYNGKITYLFETWADSLIKRGIKIVNGNIIGDDDYFDDEILGEGWAWDYQSDWYAAQISALSFNDNCLDVLLSAGDSVGAPAKYRLEPETDYVEITNHVTTVERGLQNDIYYKRAIGGNQVEINGAIAIDAQEKRDWFTIENPTLFTVTIFKKVLEQKGVIVNGVARDIDDCPDYHYPSEKQYELLNHFSPPLHKIVETINKVSQNLYAELLLRTLGARFNSHGSAQRGIEVTKELLSKIGINPSQFTMIDGSGLSPLNLVSPKQIITLLRYVRNHSMSDFFYNSLPIAGVDGSLRYRMKDTSAKGKVRAKTGYLGNVVSLSGYLTTLDNEEFAFSIMANNFTVPTSMAHVVQDLVCERLTNFSRR